LLSLQAVDAPGVVHDIDQLGAGIAVHVHQPARLQVDMSGARQPSRLGEGAADVLLVLVVSQLQAQQVTHPISIHICDARAALVELPPSHVAHRLCRSRLGIRIAERRSLWLSSTLWWRT
jgi:hypothetical protein